MTTSMTVLYCSDARPFLADELEARGWDVLRADSVMNALAMFVFYQPRVVLLAGDSPLTRDVLYHLLQITGPSVWGVDHILWCGALSREWEVPAFINLRVLPLSITPYALMMELNQVAELQPA